MDLARLGVDLWDVMCDLLSEAPTMHPGWVLHLLAWLPDDGAVAAVYALRPDDGGDVDPGPRRHFGWGVDRHLQASIWDAVAAANTGKGKPPKFPRPERAKSASRGLDAEHRRIRAAMRKA